MEDKDKNLLCLSCGLVAAQMEDATKLPICPYLPSVEGAGAEGRDGTVRR